MKIIFYIFMILYGLIAGSSSFAAEVSFPEGHLTYPVSKPVTSLDYIEIIFGEKLSFVSDHPSVICLNGEAAYSSVLTLSSLNSSSILKIDFETVIEEPGNFRILLPKGLLTNGEVENEDLAYNIEVTPFISSYEVYPEDRSTVRVSEIGEIIITFPGSSSVEPFLDYWKNPVVRIVDYGISSEEKELLLNNNIRIEDNNIVITLDDVQQLEYQLTIPSADFLISGSYVNPAIYLYYNVWDGMAEADIISAPLEDGLSTPDVKILMSWDYQNLIPTDKFKVKVENGYMEPLNVSEKDIRLINIFDPDATENVNALMINLKEALTDYINSNHDTNSIVVIVPKGIVENRSGEVNPEKIFKFSVYEASPNDISCVMTDTPGIYNLFWGNNITWMSDITYGCELTLIDTGGNITTLDYESGNTPSPGKVVFSHLNPEDLKSGLCLSFNINNLEEGRYILNVPEGLVRFNLDGNWFPDYTNPSAEISLETSGLESAVVNSFDQKAVYNLQGIKIRDGIDFNEIPPGIYIVNRRKIFVH